MRGLGLEVQTAEPIRFFWTSGRQFKRVSRCGSPNCRDDSRFLDFSAALRGVEVQIIKLTHFMDNIELPLANLCGHGDVKIATRTTNNSP